MCGINGILALRGGAGPIAATELLRTRDYMASRGPDGAGAWVSPRGDVGLGHRRLAIIDLSPAGAQPMSWADGRYQITFNGEIYNYRELREELARQGARFRSHSDTEVLLALYARDGVGMFERLRGMYAFAIWDDRERRLLLARDPYGIKPLYYSVGGGILRFASQVKALEAGGAVPGDVDPAGLVGFLLWGSVPEPFTIRRAIRALPAGHNLLVEDGEIRGPAAHHTPGQAAQALAMDPPSAVEGSIRAHLVSDVPVAVFLSAGIDSSVIAAVASRLLPEPPVTFTLRFEGLVGTPTDEGPLAAETARVLGTRHVESLIRRQDIRSMWDGMLHAMDQPSIDGLNTYVVSKAAHDAGLKVVLSGLGGDELLGGYRSFAEVPQWCRRARALSRVPVLPRVWPAVAGQVWPARPKLRAALRYGTTLPGAYFLRRCLFLPEELPALLESATVREGLSAYDPVVDTERALAPAGRNGAADGWLAVHRMESARYMGNQLLRDADWASMAQSLELRVPFVDAWLRRQLARADFEPARSGGKAEVARRVAPELPPAVLSRRKTGFSIPALDAVSDLPRASRLPGGLKSRLLAQRILEGWGIALEGRRVA